MSLCFVTRGQVVVKSKPSQNRVITDLSQYSREKSSRKVKKTCTVEYSRLRFIFKEKYESNIHYNNICLLVSVSSISSVLVVIYSI